MIADQQTMPVRAKPDQAEAKQRRSSEIETLRTILGVDLREALLTGCLIQRGQIESLRRVLEGTALRVSLGLPPYPRYRFTIRVL